ncbi:MAG: UDP-N-acetylmuramoyl-L-alanyl-D-glutamate--2,6-diaminopimelate ligase [Clostridia bacterium]|nr:UDP-N-acetylmuramoyl-L-alanyl-D-glutamate--2,6-diaminopimelate ligase [Clostridia bacterium]
MKLEKIIENLEIIEQKGDMNIDITNIHSDSRKIKQNGLFVAIKGYDQNGLDYLDSAIKNGAIAVVVEKDVEIEKLPKSLSIIKVENTRKSLAIMSCNLYDNPSKKFKLIGITGTKGKTTTTFMTKALLESHGLKVGLIGSIAVYIGDKKLEDTDRTTPESVEIQKHFAQMAEENVDVAIIEVSSQALKLERVTGCDFDIGVFTNLTEDHISKNEHADMEEYFQCKASLFDKCKIGITNADDAIAKRLTDRKCTLKTFGISNPADITADEKTLIITQTSTKFTVTMDGKKEDFEISIPGKFSVYNALGAISVAHEFGVTPEEMKQALKDLRVLGRNEPVPNKLGLTILIDYAHTPSSLQSILESVKAYAKGRIICAWGVGGDRDRAKRPIMGEISGTLADYTILMSDQVRTEDPMQILRDIEVGVKKVGGKYTIIEDRTEGIRHALKIATKEDIIVIPGLGHDLYIERNHVKYPYDERKVIAKLVDELIESGEKTPE